MPVVAAIGSIGGALIAANGAKSAANTQASAAKKAAATSAAGYLKAGDVTSAAATQAADIIGAGIGTGGQDQLTAIAKALETVQGAGDQGVTGLKSALSDADSYLKPYRDTGSAATYSLADLYGLPTPENPNGGSTFNDQAISAFRNTPGYQFAQSEGIRGVEQSAAAKGLLSSGGTLKGVTDYASNLADTTFNSYVDRLNQLSSIGLSAATTSGNQAISGANSLADLYNNNASRVATLQTAQGDTQASIDSGQANAKAKGITDAATAKAIGLTGSASSYAKGISDAGTATASGQVASTNALSGGVSDAFNNLALYNLLKSNNTSSQTASA